MPQADLEPVIIRDAVIIYPNFAGRERQYNRAGDRNFNVVLDPDTAEAMLKDGWNVKMREGREEGDPPRYTLQVKVKFGYRPPKVVMLTSRGRTFLDESSVDVLDFAELTKVDMTINPSRYEVNGKEGIAAYLKTMFATVYEDELDIEYSDRVTPGPAVESVDEE